MRGSSLSVLLELAFFTFFILAASVATSVFTSLIQTREVGGAGGTGLVNVPRGWFVVEEVKLVGVGGKEGDDVVEYVELRVYVSDPSLAGTYTIYVTLRSGETTVTGSATVYVGTSPTVVRVYVPRTAQAPDTEVAISVRRVG